MSLIFTLLLALLYLPQDTYSVFISAFSMTTTACSWDGETYNFTGCRLWKQKQWSEKCNNSPVGLGELQSGPFHIQVGMWSCLNIQMFIPALKVDFIQLLLSKDQVTIPILYTRVQIGIIPFLKWLNGGSQKAKEALNYTIFKRMWVVWSD